MSEKLIPKKLLSYSDQRMHSFLQMQQVLMCGTKWRHYNDDFIISDLIGKNI